MKNTQGNFQIIGQVYNSGQMKKFLYTNLFELLRKKFYMLFFSSIIAYRSAKRKSIQCVMEQMNKEENSHTVGTMFCCDEFWAASNSASNHLIRNKASLEKTPRAYFDWESHYFLPQISPLTQPHSFKLIQYTPFISFIILCVNIKFNNICLVIILFGLLFLGL